VIRNSLIRDKHNVGVGLAYLGNYVTTVEHDEETGRDVICRREVSAIRAYWGHLSKTVRPEHGHRQRRLAAKAARNYLGGKVPASYKCDACAATGIKLWRQYQTCAPRLLCAPCACADQKKPDDVDRSGCRGRHRSDSIGWYVPAVPDEEGVGYWGYTSVPQAGVTWWRRLPTRAGAARQWPPCDKCRKPCRPHNNAYYMLAAMGHFRYNNGALSCATRHFLSEGGCEGSPSRAQYLEGQPRDARGFEYDASREAMWREARRLVLSTSEDVLADGALSEWVPRRTER
jgi:hypothetical protein